MFNSASASYFRVVVMVDSNLTVVPQRRMTTPDLHRYPKTFFAVIWLAVEVYKYNNEADIPDAGELHLLVRLVDLRQAVSGSGRGAGYQYFLVRLTSATSES